MSPRPRPHLIGDTTGPIPFGPSRILALVVLLALATSACSSSEQPAVSAIGFAQEPDDRPIEEKVDTNGDGETSEEEIEAYAQQTFLEFSQCMRDNGFEGFTDLSLEDFTDSGENPDFLGLMAERGVTLSDPEALTSLQECGSELQQLQTFAPQPSDAEVAEQEAQLLDFAACMREQGITDWPDPDFAANPNGYGPEIAQEFDLNSSEVQEAGEACQAEGRGFAVQTPEETPEPSPTEAEADETEAREAEDATEIDSGPDEREAITGLIAGDTTDLNSAEVTRRDLIQTETLPGTLGFGDLRSFPTNSTGIVTWLPDEGDIIDIGDTLFEIDNIPVLMMEGQIPQYRRFEINMTDGPDVEQLERNLMDLNYVVDRDLTVDHDFTSVTRAVIRDMQDEQGVEDTGILELGTVVFTSGPVRVGRINVELGQSVNPQVNVLDVTDVGQAIT
ncbi:MAG: peptidoglycan-binding domain-containing protein, partial [Acidimicrobiales bacterium]